MTPPTPDSLAEARNSRCSHHAETGRMCRSCVATLLDDVKLAGIMDRQQELEEQRKYSESLEAKLMKLTDALNRANGAEIKATQELVKAQERLAAWDSIAGGIIMTILPTGEKTTVRDLVEIELTPGGPSNGKP